MESSLCVMFGRRKAMIRQTKLEIIREGIAPVLMMGSFTAICLFGSIRAARRKRAFRSGGVRVIAQVLHYSSEVREAEYGRYRERVHSVTVRCVSPADGEEQTYILETNAGKAKRYAQTETAEVLFLPGEGKPILPEDMKHIGIDRVLGIFGTVFCGLFTLLFLIALIAAFVRAES